MARGQFVDAVPAVPGKRPLPGQGLEEQAAERPHVGEGGSGPTFVIETPAVTVDPYISPDGDFFLYRAVDQERDEIWVQNISTGSRQLVSVGSEGWDPVWSRNGDEVFYGNRGAVLAVEVTRSPEVSFSAPRPLFDLGSRS